MKEKEFRLPEIGENIEEASIVAVLTETGSFVKKDGAVVELETDKAAFELPCPFEGVVEKITVSVGDKIKVGGLIAIINEGGKPQSGKDAQKPDTPAPKEKPAQKPSAEKHASAGQPEEKHAPKPAEEKDTSPVKPHASQSAGTQRQTSGEQQPPSSPSAKSLARELGIEISQVKGAGARGRVSSEDVKAHAKDLINSSWSGFSEMPDFSRWGKIEKAPVSQVGKLSAQRLARSWSNVPHVTHHDSADITELEDLRKNFSAKAEKAGGKLTMTAIIVKVVASALGVFPKFNGSFDAARSEMILKTFVNIGIAVDTERGLLLPVIKNADEKNIIEISIELSDLAKRARAKNIKPDELQGASFSVSNLGGIGGNFFTPVVNFPEVAILGLSRSKTEPVYEQSSGRFIPKTKLPLSLSYDHRMIDGAEAARFSKWITEALEEPFKLVFEG